jgi:hypothetical protein
MAQGPSPLLGYNTNVRHKGKLYHIQTEDSGVNHPHIITHLFADGGRIIASKKTSYAQAIGVEDLKSVVKKMMQEQHKAMFIALRDGLYDDGERESGESPAPPKASAPKHVDVDALDRAAARFAGSASPGTGSSRKLAAAAALSTAAAAPVPRSRPPESIFGGDLLSEKSLDEVILSYLASDLDEVEE